MPMGVTDDKIIEAIGNGIEEIKDIHHSNG